MLTAKVLKNVNNVLLGRSPQQVEQAALNHTYVLQEHIVKLQPVNIVLKVIIRVQLTRHHV